MIFTLKGKLNIDPLKKTVIFIDKGNVNSYTYIYGAARVIRESIKNQFNIITIGAGCKLTDNYYEINRSFTDDFPRKADDPDYIKKNMKTLQRAFEESFKDLPNIEYIILGTDDFFRLPLTSFTNKKFSKELVFMQNEFFDYVDDDTEMINKINIVNNYVINEWDRLVSPIAFSTKCYSLFMRCIDFINREGKLKKHVIGFSIDPAIYTPFFNKLNIQSKFYYFAKDKRGTRNFEQFDIAQMQHIIYDNKFCNDNWDDISMDKTHNMFFAGTIFQEKGSRKVIWEEFLKDVKTEKCGYYIPLRKNGIIKARDGRAKRHESILSEHGELKNLYESVKNHPHFKGVLLPSELNEHTKKYKYGMVFRCVSINDSLNFRPVLYAYMDILPLLDYQYDPAHLQIPKDIQKKILVHSAEEIDERIKYFNENNSERLSILSELKELFRINEYIDNPDLMVKEQIKKIIPEFIT